MEDEAWHDRRVPSVPFVGPSKAAADPPQSVHVHSDFRGQERVKVSFILLAEDATVCCMEEWRMMFVLTTRAA